MGKPSSIREDRTFCPAIAPLAQNYWQHEGEAVPVVHFVAQAVAVSEQFVCSAFRPSWQRIAKTAFFGSQLRKSFAQYVPFGFPKQSSH